jgi:CO/xanthine dehydrogenase Mo-binding subunit
LISDVEKVLGDVTFASDVRLPGMLHCRLVRSSEAHARLVAVDTAAAASVAGVRAVVTGEDLRRLGRFGLRFGPVIHDQAALALDTVRYVGEPVAAVVADSVDAAEDGVAAVGIEYDRLPAVFGIREAIAEGAPRLFDRPPAVDPSFVDVSVRGDAERNVCSSFRIVRGDAAGALARADHVFEHRFSSPAAQHVPLETHACIARYAAGRLTVWSGTQTPFILRAQLAGVLRLPLSSVRVIVPLLGGGFGAKAYASIEPLVAVLSCLTGRPVRLHLSRAEEFVTVTKHAMEVTLRTGVSRDGLLVARHARAYYNAGAYAGISPRKVMFGAYGINGPYLVPDVLHEVYAVYTNTPPAGAYRGFAINQCAWAYETQMDMIAEALGIDPYELRMRNLLRDGDRFCTGEPIARAHFADLLGRVATSIGYQEPRRSRPSDGSTEGGDLARGIGLSCIIEGTITPSTSTAAIKLNADGSATVLASSVEMGQGIQHALCRIVAGSLGLPLELVSAVEVDTDATPYDQQTTASRSVSSMGCALELACEQVRAQLVVLGGRLLDTFLDVVARDGRVFVRDDPARGLGYGEVVARSGVGNLLGTGTFRTEGGLDPETGRGVASAHWNQSAAAAEVEVDRRTGLVRLIAYRGAVYAGRVVDPVGAELQADGSLTFGVGNALLEDLLFDNGQPVNGSLADYMIPSLADLPEDRSFEIVADDDPGAEPHGLGEPMLPPVAPAIGNAVFDAVGVRIRDLPITAEKVLRALREAAEGGPAGAAP